MGFEKGNKSGSQFTSDKQPKKNGRPKGKSKKTKLKKLLLDLSLLNNGKDISDAQLLAVYQLYEIALCDYACGVTTTTIKHLYFIESDFGIKIGVSKDVTNRLRQIKEYAPTSIILKIIPFGGNFEGKLHKKFKRQNIKNNPVYGIEWFYKNDDLINFIDSIDKASDLACMFGSDKVGQLKLNFST